MQPQYPVGSFTTQVLSAPSSAVDAAMGRKRLLLGELSFLH